MYIQNSRLVKLSDELVIVITTNLMIVYPFFTAITERGVGVRLMLSERAYTYKHRKEHLQSLLELNKDLNKKLVQIKVFHVSQFCSTINNSQLVYLIIKSGCIEINFIF